MRKKKITQEQVWNRVYEIYGIMEEKLKGSMHRLAIYEDAKENLKKAFYDVYAEVNDLDHFDPNGEYEDMRFGEGLDENSPFYPFYQIEERVQDMENNFKACLFDSELATTTKKIEFLLGLEPGKIKKLVKLVSLQFYGIEISERTKKAFDELLEIQNKARALGFYDEAELTAIFYNYVL